MSKSSGARNIAVTGADADRMRSGPNALLTLTAARRNSVRFGAAHERGLPHVRAPLDEDQPFPELS